MNLKEQLRAIQREMQTMFDSAKAAGRELTAIEVATIETKAAEAIELRAAIERQEKGAEFIASISSDSNGEETRDSVTGGFHRSVVPDQVAGKSVGGVRVKSWVEAAGRELSKFRTSIGEKAFTTATLRVPNLLDNGNPVTIDATSTTLLDLIGRGEPAGDRVGNGFMYVRQTTRTSNAGPVADGATKPVSEYGFGEVEDHYRYFVNKTEDLPFRYLEDYPRLLDVVKVQLVEDTILAIEEDVLSGDGAAEHFAGILNTSGVQLEPWSTDRLTTLSNAKYKLITQEIPFNGWVFNPADMQALELMRENGTTGAFLFKSRAEIAEFLGAPIALTAGIPAGTAVLGDYKQAELIPLGDDELVVDTKKRTDDNTFLMMFEGRYGFRVKKPNAFVKVDLTEA